MQKAVREGGQKTPKPGGICKTFKVKNLDGIEQHIRGSWELKVVEFFNKEKIKWVRNQLSFDYKYEGAIRRYFPDFYLEDFDVYVEVKGYETEKDRAKWKDFPKKLFIIKKKELQDLKQWAFSLNRT